MLGSRWVAVPPPLGGSARKVNKSKKSVTTEQFTVDFISQLQAYEYLVSGLNSFTVYSGDDPGPSLQFIGSPTVAGTKTTQLVAGGLPGCVYQVSSEGLTQFTTKTFLNSFLVVL